MLHERLMFFTPRLKNTQTEHKATRVSIIILQELINLNTNEPNDSNKSNGSENFYDPQFLKTIYLEP